MMMAAAVGRPLTYDHTAWLLRHGLLSPAALGRYEAYALPDLIAYAYPQAEGEARNLLVDILGWFTILDDHFDGQAGRDLPGTRDLVRRLLDVLEETGPGSRTEAGTGSRTEPGTKSCTETETETETGTETGTGTGTETETGTETGTGSDAGARVDLGPERGAEHDGEFGTDGEGESGADRDGELGTDPDAERGADGDTGLRDSPSRPDACALSEGLPPAVSDPSPQGRAGHGRRQATDRLGRRHVLGSRHLVRTSPQAGPDPAQLLGAWRDLWRRQRAGMPAAWSRRAARDWALCLTTFVTEASHRTAATLPTVRQAVHLRRYASCLYPFMNMLERVRGTALPEALHAERELRLLRAHVADTATLVNDLYSLEREERHACPFNMIVILQRERRLTRVAAVDAVRAEVDRLSVRSDILRNYLAAHHPEADWYLRQTQRLVEGVKLWSSTTDRYTDTSL